MKSLARFVIRPANDKPDAKGDIVLGLLFKNQNLDLLKPGVVYEIQEIMGELMLKPIGEAAIGMDRRTSYNSSDTSWSNGVGYILDIAGGQFILTKDEMEQIRQQRSRVVDETEF